MINKVTEEEKPSNEKKNREKTELSHEKIGQKPNYFLLFLFEGFPNGLSLICPSCGNQ